MHNVSDLYIELLNAGARIETKLELNYQDIPERALVRVLTRSRVFSENAPTVGGCVSGEIEVEMHAPSISIPRCASLKPYVRLVDGSRASEWIQKGEYFVDTREWNEDGSRIRTLRLQGYDAMLRAEQPYPDSSLDWPAKDVDVVAEIAAKMGVSVDPRTWQLMLNQYSVQYPGDYSCRETLGYIASMHAGCFVMTDLGELRLITINGIPPETRYLVTENGDPITFGGEKILV